MSKTTNDESTEFTAWITKYALTSGIFTTRAVECSNGMARDTKAKYMSLYHGEGRDWHRTEESARRRFDEMREAKIHSVVRQLNKLKTMKFTVKDEQ